MGNDEKWLERALILANKAKALGEVPVGAVLVLDDEVIGEGFNSPISHQDPTAHAEILALRAGAKTLQNYRLSNTTLYVTLEPCAMCLGAMSHARVKRLVYGASDQRPEVNHNIEKVGGVLAQNCSDLLKNFFKERR